MILLKGKSSDFQYLLSVPIHIFNRMNELASFLMERGSTCIETDLAIPQSSMTDSKVIDERL